MGIQGYLQPPIAHHIHQKKCGLNKVILRESWWLRLIPWWMNLWSVFLRIPLPARRAGVKWDGGGEPGWLQELEFRVQHRCLSMMTQSTYIPLKVPCQKVGRTIRWYISPSFFLSNTAPDCWTDWQKTWVKSPSTWVWLLRMRIVQ